MDVPVGNERARRFYERFGFRTVALEPPKCRLGLAIGVL